MSRSFTSDQELIDRLILNDTDAFEELYRRYWYSLYTYCLKKLQSSDDSRQIVRDIFIQLWEKRQSWPIDFSVSHHLYTQVRQSVVRCLNHKLMSNDYNELLEQQISTGFTVEALSSASKPVNKQNAGTNKLPERLTDSTVERKKDPKYYSLIHMKWLLQMVSAKLH